MFGFPGQTDAVWRTAGLVQTRLGQTPDRGIAGRPGTAGGACRAAIRRPIRQFAPRRQRRRLDLRLLPPHQGVDDRQVIQGRARGAVSMILALAVAALVLSVLPAAMFLANLPLFRARVDGTSDDGGRSTVTSESPSPPSVSVLIPARNEE